MAINDPKFPLKTPMSPVEQQLIRQKVGQETKNMKPGQPIQGEVMQHFQKEARKEIAEAFQTILQSETGTSSQNPSVMGGLQGTG